MVTLLLDPESTNPRLVQIDKQALVIGKAAGADLSIQNESLADYHARIERKADGLFLINLQAVSNVWVNGEPVSFQKLKHGDRLMIGDVKAVVMLDEQDSPDCCTPERVAPNSAAMPVLRTPAFAAATLSQSCPHCGFQVSAHMPRCPQCGCPLSNHALMQTDFIPPTPISQAGPGILPVIAFLAALTVVGAPIALILGLMTLSIIRRRGGTVRDRALAKWAIGLGLVWLMLGAAGAAGLVRKEQRRNQLNMAEVSEAKVIRALKNLACAQKYAQTIEAFDADADGNGEYGTLSVLAETRSPFFDADLADGEAYGYWFAIREASEGQFLAVAEPVRYGQTGLRTFVINQDGQIRGSDTEGQRYGQVAAVLPVLQGERSAYYEIDNEIAKDVLNYVKSLSSNLPDQEKKQRILKRLRTDYALTTVGRELDGLEASVDRFVTEERAQSIYLEAKTALAEGHRDVALAKLMELKEKHAAFSGIAEAERDLNDLRLTVAQDREKEAQDLLLQAEEKERLGQRPEEVQQIYQRIEKFYPDTDVASRIASLKPELQRQLRERNAEDVFSDLMELSPERDFDEILNRANQLRRNYGDTDLFGKVTRELAEKERKARAGSWRAKTAQNMAAGRMRAALAQLESAARENPDLLYDLRDLCKPLYRNVADALLEEGDARKALVYYERLNQLVQSSGSEEQVSPDLLAKLHNDVGQTDFERKEYAEARWHLAGAAWKYADNAQFNMRLGAASLYTGLYRPAETALAQALTVQTNMAPARLYRAYLNMRVVLSLERALADRLKPPAAVETKATPAPGDTAQPSNAVNITVDSRSDDGDDVKVTASTGSDSSAIAAVQTRDVKYANVGENWFSKFAENETAKDSPVPDPKDVKLFLSFDYHSSSGISPDILQFLEELQLQSVEKSLAVSKARTAANKTRADLDGIGGEDARKKGQLEVKVSSKKNIAAFHTQLNDLRSVHLTDADARNELYDMMNEMKRRVSAARADLLELGTTQPHIQSLVEHVLQQIDAKYGFLTEADTLISGSMREEIALREQMLKLAEKVLLKDLFAADTSSSFESDVSRFRTKLFEQNSLVKMDQALRALRNSMEMRVDLDNLLRAAEGNTQVAAEE